MKLEVTVKHPMVSITQYEDGDAWRLTWWKTHPMWGCCVGQVTHVSPTGITIINPPGGGKGVTVEGHTFALPKNWVVV